MGDVIEAQAIHRVYGNKPFVTGFKSYMGHTMGSCGVIETIIILYLMSEGIVPPTLNLNEVDKQCAMINHVITPQSHFIRTAAIQNFAFGGVNTNLIIKNL
jgi:3-oxoacyl-[acyl-carrier-protein] synthase II